jgi:hypothetical protein
MNYILVHMVAESTIRCLSVALRDLRTNEAIDYVAA